MRKLKTVLLLIAIQSLQVNAQVPALLDSIFNHTLDSLHNLIGNKSLSAAVELPDTSVWAGVAGISSVNPPVNASIDDVYHIGSVTKTITAACILQLAEQNVLNLDDSLHTWLDTIQYIDPNITIRQLLRHQSGLYDVLTNPANQPAMLADPDSIWNTSDIITTFINPPLFAAGSSWSYCNTNYLLLSMIIEAATGNTWYDELRSRFFIPLSMNSLSAWPYEPINNTVAHLWLDLNGDGTTDDAHNFFMNTPSLNASGGAAGCYFATASDITRWMHRHMSGEIIDPSIMSQAYVTVFAPGMPGVNCGLGLMQKTFHQTHMAYGHGGDFGYSASSWYFPAEDISITVLNNDADHNSWGLVPVVTALLKAYLQWSTPSTVNESNHTFNCKAFPNPVSNNLTFEITTGSPEDVSLTIYDAFGREMRSSESYQLHEGKNAVTINSSEWASGIYYASVSSSESKKTIRIVKN